MARSKNRRTLGRRRSRPSRAGRQEAGGSLYQRSQERRLCGAGRARGGHGARRARGQLRRPCRSGAAGEEPARARFARSEHARRRRAGTARTRGGGGGHGGPGRQQIRRRRGLGRHRRPGAGDKPRLPWRGHRTRTTRSRCRRSPATAPAWRPITITPRRCTPPTWKAQRPSGAAPASARSSGSIRAKSPRAACRWCSTRASRAR